MVQAPVTAMPQATCVWHGYSCRPGMTTILGVPRVCWWPWPALVCCYTVLKPRLLHFIGSYSCFVVSTRQRGSQSAGLLLPWQPQLCVCVVRDVQIVLESSPPPAQVLKYCLTRRSFKTRPMSLIPEHFKRFFIHYLHRKSSTSIILVENVVKDLIILKFIHCPWDELFLTS